MFSLRQMNSFFIWLLLLGDVPLCGTEFWTEIGYLTFSYESLGMTRRLRAGMNRMVSYLHDGTEYLVIKSLNARLRTRTRFPLAVRYESAYFWSLVAVFFLFPKRCSLQCSLFRCRVSEIFGILQITFSSLKLGYPK